MRWSDIKERLAIWASRSSENRLIKYIRVNPVHPFDRRAAGVYVLNHLHTNHLTTASLLLLVAISYLLSLTSDSSNFSRLDIIFFPVIAILIGLLLLWRNIWTYSLVLNYPALRYEYYISRQLIAVGPIHDAFIRLKLLLAGEEDMFYKLVVGASHCPELDLTFLSGNGGLLREVGKRLARTLEVNYFDIMDLSHLHECRHATSRHLRNLLRRPVNMESSLQEETDRKYLVDKLDRGDSLSGSAPVEVCNWPFLTLEKVNLGVPLETVRRYRETKQTRETWAWRLRDLAHRAKTTFTGLKIGLLGRDVDSARDAEVGLRHHQDPDELTEKEKTMLIHDLEDVERDIRLRKISQWFLPLRTSSSRKQHLSVEQQEIMVRVARFMVLRNSLRSHGHPVTGITADLGFIWIYTAHPEYVQFYRDAMDEMAPRGICRRRQVHPLIVTASGREIPRDRSSCCAATEPRVGPTAKTVKVTRVQEAMPPAEEQAVEARKDVPAEVTFKETAGGMTSQQTGGMTNQLEVDGGTNVVVISEGEIAEMPISEIASMVAFDSAEEDPMAPADEGS